MTAPKKLDQPARYWDRLFAPSSCLAMITTVDAQGRVNAASNGTCIRVHHEPVFIAFTASVGADNEDCVDAEGYILRDKAKSAHYGGAPYGGQSVAAYETLAAKIPYDGPEVEALIARESALWKEH